MKEVVLEYRRVNGSLSTGSTYCLEGKEKTDVKEFEAEEFTSMLRHFAKVLHLHPQAKVIWQRTDRPGLQPYILDSQVVDLFLSDVEAAIASMNPAAYSPSMAAKRIIEEREPPAGLRVGFDTLADAFGDLVYARVRENGALECPCCGIWSKPDGATFSCKKACPSRGLTFSLRIEVNSKWAGFSVNQLLATGSPRFYLPRAWNRNGTWIEHKRLQEMFDEYLKEKNP